MKKEKLITRTMTITSATAMLVNITAQVITTNSFTLIGRHTKESALSCVTDLLTVEEIRSMTETDFYLHSKIITR